MTMGTLRRFILSRTIHNPDRPQQKSTTNAARRYSGRPFPGASSSHIAFSAAKEHASPSPRIQLKYHITLILSQYAVLESAWMSSARTGPRSTR